MNRKLQRWLQAVFEAIEPVFDLAIEARWLWQQIPGWVQAATHRTER